MTSDLLEENQDLRKQVEELKELLNRSNIRLAEEQIKNAQNKKEVEQEIVEEDVYFNPY